MMGPDTGHGSRELVRIEAGGFCASEVLRYS